MTTPVIAAEGLTKRYGRHRGIVDLDMKVREGEVFGFLGPNGAGKTTAIRTLMDFIRPTRGRALVFGLDCRREGRAIRRDVGYLPGEFTLYEHLTGRQFLAYLGALRGGVGWSVVDDLAGRLDSDLSRPLGHLSHGNKQKVGLIQALMGRPRLLILDEPTSGLDPLIQRAFYECLAEIRDDGRTVFLSSHVLPEVERVCDRVGIIRDGRLVRIESVAAIKKMSVRKVEITFDRVVGPEAFEGLPGVRDVRVQDARLRCTVQGSIDPLMKAASRHVVVDLISHEPDLEEVFMALYGDDR